MDIATMLQLPFMQRAFMAGAMLAVLLAVLGVFVTLRRMAFFGEGIAHATLAGIAIAVLTGLAPLPIALAWAVLVAMVIFFLERSSKLPRDTIIGILFTSSMALGVVLMSFSQGYQADLVSYLFGSILAITQTDILVLAFATAAILAIIFGRLRSLTLLSLNPDIARVQGIKTQALTLTLYLTLAIAIVLGVKMLGIILISALLIIPAASGRLLATSLKSYLALSVVFALVSVLVGLTASYFFDLPSGASIVLASAILFALSLLVREKN